MTNCARDKLSNAHERGATVVEFAFIAALVLVIVFGILEFGLIFLQEHYVADAAREGARIGVRANNYDCFDVNIPSGATCTSYRVGKTRANIEEYLNVFYDSSELTITVQSQDLDEDISTDNDKILLVDVRTTNFAPGLVSALLKIIPLPYVSNVHSPTTIAFTTAMAYEDPKEFDAENE